MEISVIIPLYNKKEGIIRALNSVFRQSYSPKEIIVVNDGSTDSSEQLVVALHHPLVYLVNQKNAGVSAARNNGIELAQSKWIAFLDADDYWEENYLQTIKQLQVNNPTAKVLATNYRYQLNVGLFKPTILNYINFGDRSQGILTNYFEVAASSSPPICSSAVLVDKNELQKIGGFPIGIKSGEDLITWARLAVDNIIAYSKEPLATFVLDPAHSYQAKPNRIPQTPDIVGLELQKLKNNNPQLIGLMYYLAHWHKMRASIFLRLGKRQSSFIEVKKALKYSFWNKKLWIYLFLLILPVAWTLKLFKKNS